MNNLLKLTITAIAATLIAGCAKQTTCGSCGQTEWSLTVPAVSVSAIQPGRGGSPEAASQAERERAAAAEALYNDVQVISVTGYGAPKSTFENLAQRRLMALRASELDAYRKITEQVSGLHIVGDTRVDDYITNRDRLRTYINSFVQGAAIIRQDFEADGMATTEMSLKISRSQMRKQLERERLWHARGGHLPDGAAYHDGGLFLPHY